MQVTLTVTGKRGHCDLNPKLEKLLKSPRKVQKVVKYHLSSGFCIDYRGIDNEIIYRKRFYWSHVSRFIWGEQYDIWSTVISFLETKVLLKDLGYCIRRKQSLHKHVDLFFKKLTLPFPLRCLNISKYKNIHIICINFYQLFLFTKSIKIYKYTYKKV